MSIPEEVKVPEQPQTTPGISPENDINWKNFREQRAAERKQAEEARAAQAKAEKEASALKAAMEALLSKNQPHHPTNANFNDDNHEETEEQRLEKLIEAKWAKKEREQEQARQEREQAEIPLKMKQIHSDFDDVCSQDNIDYLEHHHPEIYRAFKSAPDSIQKFGDAYKVIKKLIPNYNSKKDEHRADKNTAKPQSMNTPGLTQSGDMAPKSALDAQRRADNWRRMQQVMRSGSR
jgi:hypothetical protein